MTGVRWDPQRLDAEEPTTLPGMPTMRGLLRSVQVPEFPGLTFHEVRSKSALNEVPGDSPVPFRWTINPYRGCSHACLRCAVAPLFLFLSAVTRRSAMGGRLRRSWPRSAGGPSSSPRGSTTRRTGSARLWESPVTALIAAQDIRAMGGHAPVRP
jgi:hypothetical protein